MPAPPPATLLCCLALLQVAIYACVSVALIMLSGLVSGLTLGLLSLDKLDLEVVKRRCVRV